MSPSFGNVPIIGQSGVTPYAGTDDVTRTLDVHDSEVDKIHHILERLRERATMPRNYDEYQREIIERFQDIGFVVDVRWYETNQNGVLMPEINISGRIETGYVFDRDKQVAEVTGDLLGLGEGGTIKVDKGMVAALESGSYRGTSKHEHP